MSKYEGGSRRAATECCTPRRPRRFAFQNTYDHAGGDREWLSCHDAGPKSPFEAGAGLDLFRPRLSDRSNAFALGRTLDQRPIRRARVSGRLALTTQKVATRLSYGAWPSKNANAFSPAASRAASAAENSARSRSCHSAKACADRTTWVPGHRSASRSTISCTIASTGGEPSIVSASLCASRVSNWLPRSSGRK